jgi:hypothetical protein
LAKARVVIGGDQVTDHLIQQEVQGGAGRMVLLEVVKGHLLHAGHRRLERLLVAGAGGLGGLLDQPSAWSKRAWLACWRRRWAGVAGAPSSAARSSVSDMAVACHPHHRSAAPRRLDEDSMPAAPVPCHRVGSPPI